MRQVFTCVLFLTSTLIGKAEKCALMSEDDIDTQESTVVSGKALHFCCGSCVTKFEQDQAYYIKAVKSLYDRFTPSERKKLGVDQVKLLDQRHCPVYPDRLVGPSSPTVEYNGKTIRLWSSSATRRWNRDPERYYKAAIAAGVLK